MGNIYSLSGKKIVYMEEADSITYKDIMKNIIEYATEEGCHEIFCHGGINMCPSDVFGPEKVSKKEENYKCEIKSIGCTKCWTDAVAKLKKGKIKK